MLAHGGTLVAAVLDEVSRIVHTRPRLQADVGEIRCLIALKREKRLLATGGDEKVVRLWDWGAQKSNAALIGATASISAIASNADASIIAAGSDDGAVSIWQSNNTAVTQQFQAHSGKVLTLAVLPHGRQIVTAGMDGLKLWALED